MKITRNTLKLTGAALLTLLIGYEAGRIRTQTVAQRDIAQKLGTPEYIDFVQASVPPDEFRRRKVQINFNNLNHRYLAPFDWKDYADEVGRRLKNAKDNLSPRRIARR